MTEPNKQTEGLFGGTTKSTVAKSPVVNPQQQTLIDEAAKRNAELAKQKTTVKTTDVSQLDKLNAIKDVLRDSGADSNSQGKAFHRIVEILGW